MKTFKKGFTLIELLIVIVIIGILAVGFAPSLLSGPKKARDAVRKGNLEIIRKAVDAYSLENSSKYPDDGGGRFCFKGSKLAENPNAYFQGGILPADPSGPTYEVVGKGCLGDFVYRKIGDTTGCYILAAKVEVAASGSTDAALGDIADCDDAVKKSEGTSGSYFYKVVKF